MTPALVLEQLTHQLNAINLHMQHEELQLFVCLVFTGKAENCVPKLQL